MLPGNVISRTYVITFLAQLLPPIKSIKVSFVTPGMEKGKEFSDFAPLSFVYSCIKSVSHPFSPTLVVYRYNQVAEVGTCHFFLSLFSANFLR